MYRILLYYTCPVYCLMCLFATVAALGGFLYIAGGEETNDQRSPLNTAYRLNPRNNSWLQIASMKHRRESFQLGILNGMLYAVGQCIFIMVIIEFDSDVSHGPFSFV